MRLPQTRAAVDEERVVGLRRRFGDGQRRRVREPVRRPDDEVVERVLRVRSGLTVAHGCRRRRRDRPVRLAGGLDHLERHLHLAPERVPHGALEESEEVARDPGARELVRDGEHERVLTEGDGLRRGEPHHVGRLVEGVPEPSGDVVPELLCGRLDGVVHALLGTPSGGRRRGEHTTVARPRPRLECATPISEKNVIYRAFFHLHTDLHSCGQASWPRPSGRRSPPVSSHFEPVAIRSRCG